MSNQHEKISESTRVAVAQRANEQIAQNNIEGARDTLAALLEVRIKELRSYPKLADQLDLQLILLAGDVSTNLCDEITADLFYEFASDLATNHANNRLRVFANAKRMLAAIQSGNLSKADEALCEIDPGLPGRVISMTKSEDLKIWEQTESWIVSGPDNTIAPLSTVLAYVYWAIARYLAAQGHFNPSFLCLKRAQEVCQNFNGPSELKNGGLELAAYLGCDWIHLKLQCGELETANHLLQKYSENENFIHQLKFQIKFKGLQARLDLLRGNLGDCKKKLYEVVLLAEKIGPPLAFGRTIINLSRFLILINQAAKAQDLLLKTKASLPEKTYEQLKIQFERAFDLAKARQTSNTWDHTFSLSSIYEEGSIFPKAAILVGQSFVFPMSTDQLGRANDFEAWFNHEAAEFRARLYDDNFEKATPVLKDLTYHFGDSDSSLIQGKLILLHGMLALRNRKIPQATQYFEEARRLFTPEVISLELWQCLTFLILCYKMMGRSTEANDAAISANKYLQQMASSLSPADRDLFMIDKWSVEEQFLGIQIDQLEEQTQFIREGPFYTKPFRWVVASLQLLRILAFGATYRGSQMNHSLNLDIESKPPRSPSLLRFLISHSLTKATLYFLVLSDRTLVVSHSFCFLKWEFSRAGSARVRQGVRWWHRLSSKWWENFCRHYELERLFPEPDHEKSISLLKKISRRLAKELKITKMVEKLPVWVAELVIVPDEALHMMPLVAIPYKDQYLFEHYTITYSFQLPEISSEKKGVHGLVVDVSQFLTLAEEQDSLPELPGAHDEGDLIEKTFTQDFGLTVTRFSSESRGAKPFKSDVINSLRNCKFAHFSCHGLFNQQAPFDSGLALASPTDEADILSVKEISKEDFFNIKQLSMSGCYSADALTLPGRWVIGLPEVFCRAGVAYVSGFFWQVEDKIGMQLMSLYYQFLHKKLSPAKAMQEARKAFLNDSFKGLNDLPTHHPFFWASMNLYARQ